MFESGSVLVSAYSGENLLFFSLLIAHSEAVSHIDFGNERRSMKGFV